MVDFEHLMLVLGCLLAGKITGPDTARTVGGLAESMATNIPVSKVPNGSQIQRALENLKPRGLVQEDLRGDEVHKVPFYFATEAGLVFWEEQFTLLRGLDDHIELP